MHTPKTPLALEPLVWPTGCIIPVSFEPVVPYPGELRWSACPGK
jgi:hypothetical protein